MKNQLPTNSCSNPRHQAWFGKGRRVVVLFIVFSFLGACGYRAQDDAGRLAASASGDLGEGRYEAAFQKLQKASELQPEVPQYHVGLGMAAARLNKPEIASKEYQIAESILAREAAKDPDRVPDHAFIVGLQGRTNETRTILSEGAERFPDSRRLQKIASNPELFIAGIKEPGPRKATTRTDAATPIAATNTTSISTPTP